MALAAPISAKTILSIGVIGGGINWGSKNHLPQKPASTAADVGPHKFCSVLAQPSEL